MVNSSIYNNLFQKKRGGGVPVKPNIRNSLGLQHYNLMGGSPFSISSSSFSSFFKLINEKKTFLLSVFTNLIFQLGLTYYVMMNFSATGSVLTEEEKLKNNDASMTTTEFWGIFVVQIIIICMLALVPMASWIKLILFTLFSFLWGLTLVTIRQKTDSNIIQMALCGTISIFGLMFLFGAGLLLFGVKLGYKVASFLFFALLLLIIVQLILLFIGTYSIFIKAISVISLFLFSLYIIYDTNKILQRDYYGDFITASLDYYLDVLNIFIDIVGIYGNN